MRGGSGDRKGSGGGINAALQARPLTLAPMGAGRPSTTFLVASSIVVDSVPAPAMTGVGSVALLPDFTVTPSCIGQPRESACVHAGLATTAERGLFDSVLLADTLAVGDD